MDSSRIRELLSKQEALLEKKKQTIEKKRALEKKKLKVQELGYTVDTKIYEVRDNQDVVNALLDYTYTFEDLKELEKSCRSIEAKIQDLEDKLRDAHVIEDRSNYRCIAVDQIVKVLVDSWVRTDIEAREQMLLAKKEMSPRDFRKEYSYSEEYHLDRTDEEFIESETKNAQVWAREFYERVRAKVGEIINLDELKYINYGLNGFVYGENGKAKVQTIKAGGYNIQHLHISVLIDKLD